MKKILLITLLFIMSGTKVQAQSNQRIYDCSKTGKCLEGDSVIEALYANNLTPGIVSKQEWYLNNDSAGSCRVYLRLRSLDDEKLLPDKISLSAVGKIKNTQQEIIKKTKFAKLLEKQSIYLGKLPPHSTGEITWSILLDESVGNNFQATQKKFSTLLYSYCLSDKKGQVAGVTTQDGEAEKTIYAVLSILSISSIILIKIKFSSTT